MKYIAFASKLATIIVLGFSGYLTHVEISEANRNLELANRISSVKREQPMNTTKQTAPQFYGTVSGIVSELTIHPDNWYSFVLGKAKLNAKGTPPDWLLDGQCIKIDFRSASMELVTNEQQ